MQKRGHLHLRALCALLAACLAAVVCAPVAIAAPAAASMAPGLEARLLATDQRSINNPQGVTVLPEANPRFWPIHPDTQRAGVLLIMNTLQQLLLGNADPEAPKRIFEYMPIVTRDQLPPPAKIGLNVYLPLYMIQNSTRNNYLVLMETDQPDLYEVIPLMSTRSNELIWASFGIFYDASTGWIRDASERGMLYLGYDYNLDYTLSATPLGWQRWFGFSPIYDYGAPLVGIHIDTLRFIFPYDGREYIVHMWKGSYGPSNGGEIGLYETSDSIFPWPWYGSDTRLEMSMRVYQGDKLYLEHGPETTWWLGAFRYGNARRTPLLPAGELRMTGSIRFEDKAMLDAFLVSFEENRPANITGSAKGLLFTFDWQAENRR